MVNNPVAEAGRSIAPGFRELIARRVRTLASVVWPIGGLVAIYLVIDVVVRRITDLGEAGYREPSLMIELSRQTGFVVPVLILVGGFALWRTGSFGLRWPGFDRGWSLRLPVGTAIILLTWWFGAYEYNLYLDRGHWGDRAGLVVLAGLAMWRPVFTMPWLLVVTTIIQQFDYPLGGYSVAEQYQMVRVVEVFIAMMIIRLVFGRWRTSDFLVVLLSLIASGYFVSGVGKLRLGWLEVGAHLETNLLATYSNGWLGALGFDAISSVGRVVRLLAWPMLVGTVIVELGAVLMLWGRRLLVPRLGLFVAFHMGILGLTGIFFWRWIILELALIAFLLRDRLLATIPIFTRSYVVIGMALLLTAPAWAQPANLSWLDSPVNYVYRLEAIDAAGQSGQLPPEFFRPYDYQFTLSGFGYLSQARQLPIVWGAIHDRDLVEALHDAGSPDEILAIEATFGAVRFDKDRAAEFGDFVSTFVSNWNQKSRPRVLSALQAPPQLWTFGHETYAGDGPIESVTVSQIMTYWDGEDYREIRTTTVSEIDIG